MNELLDIEIILKRDKYPVVYNMGIIGVLIIGIFIVLASIYDYRTYLVTEARVVDNELELLVRSDEVKYVVDNNKVYQYIYLEVNNTLKINNYLYQIRVLKEEKKLIKYLKNYL